LPIDEVRQKQLGDLIAGGDHPFASNPPLTRDDIEWLLLLRGSRSRELDLRGADLRHANLSGLHLAMAQLQGAYLDDADLTGTDLTGAHLEAARMNRAQLRNAQLVGAWMEAAELANAKLRRTHMDNAHLEGATCRNVNARGAVLAGAYLGGANFMGAHLEGSDLRDAKLFGAVVSAKDVERIHQAEDFARSGMKPVFPARLSGAHLETAIMDPATQLQGLCLGTNDQDAPFLADVRWGGANLSLVKWHTCRFGEMGAVKDKSGKSHKQRVEDCGAAVRLNRQLAAELRNQGINEAANRYALRAHIMQRKLHWHERRPISWIASCFLNLVSGYGYRPWASVAIYAFVIGAFGFAYYEVGAARAPHLNIVEALTFSILSFHGKSGGQSLGDLIVQLSAIEAILGLLIEVTFIVSFTQRVFQR
jgi:uncharacterized protein YjbI with pentapeptide repeats